MVGRIFHLRGSADSYCYEQVRHLQLERAVKSEGE